ncbi:MAG: hypothetical protein OHK0037_24060 [Elainellaceae cyanobacterium]
MMQIYDAKRKLLLELNHPDECCDYFYFFIEEEDLANLDLRARHQLSPETLKDQQYRARPNKSG